MENSTPTTDKDASTFALNDQLGEQLAIIKYSLEVLKAQDALSAYCSNDDDTHPALRELLPSWENDTSMCEIARALLDVMKKATDISNEIFERARNAERSGKIAA